jgi:hypothetical protein
MIISRGRTLPSLTLPHKREHVAVGAQDAADLSAGHHGGRAVHARVADATAQRLTDGYAAALPSFIGSMAVVGRFKQMNYEALADALRQLYVLGALGPRGDITPLGSRMARLPLEPGLARALLAAEASKRMPGIFSATKRAASSITGKFRFTSRSLLPGKSPSKFGSRSMPPRLAARASSKGCPTKTVCSPLA